MGLLVLLLCWSLVSGVFASHLQGGIMTFTPKGRNPDGTIRVDFRYKESFRTGCHREFYWNCRQGNCGSIEHFEYGTIDSDPLGDSWCQAEGYMSRSISSDKPFDLQETSCCWIFNSHSASSWLLLTHVDLGTRSDTGFPNRSPVTTIPPIIRVPQNCPATYSLMAHDPDGDSVRCRYGIASSSECYSCYQHPNFHLDERTCTLSFNGAGFGTAHVFELVLEDFPRQYITLRYGDGTTSTRIPFNFHKKHQSNFNTTPWRRTTTTASSPSTTPPYTWWWRQPTSSTAPTTTAPTTSTQQNWWWYYPSTTTTAPSTSPEQNWWWYDPSTTTTAPSTSPQQNWWWYYPSTTTTAPSTSPQQNWWWYDPSATTTAPSTSPQQNWWWYYPSTTTTAPTTSPATPAQTTTTTAAPTNAALTTTPLTTTPFTTSSNYYDPLSKIPLQFVVQVDSAVPSCNFGEYRPEFLAPTPAHGIYVNASVGHEFQIPLRAAATRDRIYDIKMSGPLNITKSLKNYDSNSGVIDVMITWTPTENDFGEHIPICFIAETASGYQSEMRCIIVVVVNEIGEADIECTDTTMTLYISKSSVRGLHENHLRLNDPTCSVTSNGSHIIASVSLNSCGTKLEETENDLIFRNEITSFDHPHDIITRKHQIEIPFICKFPKKSRLLASFKAHKSAYLFTEAGFGSFTYLFEFYDSSDFSRMINPNTYPIEVELQDMIYMGIQVQSSLSTTQLFVESCRATPNDNPNDPLYYDIISNGCIEDETTVVYLNNQTDFRFGLEAFNFIGNYEQVFISCTVILCVAGDPDNRCAQGCTNGTSFGHHHRKRSLASQSQRHFISQGPLQFARSSSGSPGSNLNLNLNILVVAVAFCAAVALVCGVLIYKAKMAKIVKYETVPSADF
ncbi:uncharacterized protein LOC131701832 [Acipenser ruthenus]|uniref:uncharacterized protein LOC131701832 n=1 Tax=Acipenser ruthenus TaxID=7906 RepID=UPI0027426446|nr:uncharacterized protein LOC131701832 [Acipenser ruthenus]